MSRRYMREARGAVLQECHRIHLGPFNPHTLEVLWFAKVLQNWKAVLQGPTGVLTGYFWEVTYNGDKREAYVDTYVRNKNIQYVKQWFADSIAYTPEVQALVYVTEAIREAKEFGNPPSEAFYVVWQSHTETGWQAMVSTDITSGQYFRVTYDDRSGMNVVEHFVKQANGVVQL